MPQDTLEQRAVLWTQALVRVPSVSGSPACLQVLETARDLIESTGVEADIRILFPERPTQCCSPEPAAAKRACPTHALGTRRRRPPAGMEDPWSARIEGDRMHGRGTTDMKSGAAVRSRHFVKPLVKASTAYFGSFSLQMKKPRHKVSSEHWALRMLRVLSSASFVNQRGCAYVLHIAATAGSAWTLPARARTRAPASRHQCH